MADTLVRTGTLDGWAARFAALPDSVVLLPEPFHAMTTVRTAAGPGTEADPGTATALAELAALPGPNAWAGERITAIRLGPDELLLTSPFHTPHELEELARGTGAPAVDVSAQRTTIRLRGAHARDVLETGCAVDLHPRAFGAGSAAVTLLGQAGVILLGLGPAEYRILVRSSVAAYLADWLIDAALEYQDPS
ncbi:hypothetical protein GCM10009836_13800 [Pseudonocardia ailaonensis]|uniref:Sarcosine oxidase subunit gamma n=1 Tax=Pseudonocardia ailaonensis TaxID=367279 RepID=A0ABN2MV26_9PSEU